MAHEPTEDISGDIDPFAIDESEDNITDDEEQTVETVLIKDIRKYLKEAIAEEDSVDQIDLTEQAKMTPTQQIAVHKLVKNHLQNIKQIIDDKVKEN